MSDRGMDIDAALAEISSMAEKIGELKSQLMRLNQNGVHIAVLIDPMKVIAPGTLESPRFVPKDSPPPGPTYIAADTADRLFDAIVKAKGAGLCNDPPLPQDTVVSVFRSERAVLLKIFTASLKIHEENKMGGPGASQNNN